MMKVEVLPVASIATVEGVIVPGDGRGAGLGFPTANLDVDQQDDLPRDGVYSCRVHLADGSVYGGTVSVGFNPTFPDVKNRRVEVFVHDFRGNLYDQKIRVDFVTFMHEMVAFSEVEQLINHTHQLVEKSKKLLADE